MNAIISKYWWSVGRTRNYKLFLFKIKNIPLPTPHQVVCKIHHCVNQTYIFFNRKARTAIYNSAVVKKSDKSDFNDLTKVASDVYKTLEEKQSGIEAHKTIAKATHKKDCFK